MFSQRVTNVIQTAILLLALVALLLALGWFFAGIYGVLWAIFIGVIPLFVSLRMFPTLVLKMYGACPLDSSDVPLLAALVEELGTRAGLVLPPRLYYITSKTALVFSTGWGNRSSIAVTGGLLGLLSLRELAGVLAHEISHIRNKDTWVMSFADMVSRVTGILSFLGQLLIIVNLPLIILKYHSLPWIPLLLMLFAPVFSALLQLALSRTREFSADLDAAGISGDPAGLAAALAKLETYQTSLLKVGPFRMRKRMGPALLRTHPLTEERIQRLRLLEEEMDRRGNDRHPTKNGHLTLPGHLAKEAKSPRRHAGGLWY
ncbi:MAG TPA: zinc metalloprotease HtpX [Geobacteraceae bacterium]